MKNKNKTYYSLFQNEDSAVLNIFGDITSYAWEEYGEMSNVLLSKKLEELGNVSVIDVYINSYGGEVAEGLAIYNALKRHSAKIRTHVDGFACSIASVIFMAGDERIMPNTSCLMIHNPWICAAGNSKELRKQAEDLDVIGESSINAYLERVNISREELQKLLDNETWLSPKEALDMGFATSNEKDEDDDNVSQSVKSKVINMLITKQVKEECNPSSTIEEEDTKDNVVSNTETIEQGTDKTSDDEENEEKRENNEEKDNPTEKLTEYVGVFLKNLEREML